MSRKVGVLGVGRVGAVIAAELAKNEDLEVAVADVSDSALSQKFLSGVASKTKLSEGSESFIEQQELVVNCVPGFMGYKTLESILQAKRPCIDISFFPEDHTPLVELAKSNGVEAWFDMGLAPGMSSITGSLLAAQGECTSLDLFVGGLPVDREYPLQYKAVFSPSDVVDEYLRPSRIKRGGEILSVAPLTEPEFLHFDGVGTVEAFITDGLRSLVDFLDVPNMREMTIRYPGHREIMWSLRELGFFSDDKVQTRSGENIIAREATEAVLAESWNLAPAESDRTLFLARALYKDGTSREVTMLDQKDLQSGYSSMARTTGFVAVAAMEFLARNEKILGPGVFAPERIPENKDALSYLIEQLKLKNVDYEGISGLL